MLQDLDFGHLDNQYHEKFPQAHDRVLCMRKGDILEATRFANLAAALSVTREGAYSSIPTLAEVKEFSKLMKNKDN